MPRRAATAVAPPPPLAAEPIAKERLDREQAALAATEREVEDLETAIAGADCDKDALDRAIASRDRALARLEALRDRVLVAEIAFDAACEHDFGVRRDAVEKEIDKIQAAIATGDTEIEGLIREFHARLLAAVEAQQARVVQVGRLNAPLGDRGARFVGKRSPWAGPEMVGPAGLAWRSHMVSALAGKFEIEARRSGR